MGGLGLADSSDDSLRALDIILEAWEDGKKYVVQVTPEAGHVERIALEFSAGRRQQAHLRRRLAGGEQPAGGRQGHQADSAAMHFDLAPSACAPCARARDRRPVNDNVRRGFRLL